MSYTLPSKLIEIRPIIIQYDLILLRKTVNSTIDSVSQHYLYHSALFLSWAKLAVLQNRVILVKLSCETFRLGFNFTVKHENNDATNIHFIPYPHSRFVLGD